MATSLVVLPLWPFMICMDSSSEKELCRETAKLAVKELNDCALSYMIIHVTLASSRKKSNTNSRKPKRSYLSGYGKALPQTAGKH